MNQLSIASSDSRRNTCALSPEYEGEEAIVSVAAITNEPRIYQSDLGKAKSKSEIAFRVLSARQPRILYASLPFLRLTNTWIYILPAVFLLNDSTAYRIDSNPDYRKLEDSCTRVLRREMATGDVESIGRHCALEYCGQLDFLPFPCASCEK